MKLELLNREENYNKVFGNQPKVQQVSFLITHTLQYKIYFSRILFRLINICHQYPYYIKG